MKTLAAALTTANSAKYHSYAMCFKVTWKNGTVRGFTTYSRDLSVDGVIYRASSAFDPTQIRASSGMNVDGLEIVGACVSPAPAPLEVMEAYWDGARVEVFEIIGTSPAAGKNILRKGWIGSITAKGITFDAEMRGLMHRLQQQQGRVIQEQCIHNFCDYPSQAIPNAKCGLTAATYKVTGTVDDLQAICDANYQYLVSYLKNDGADQSQDFSNLDYKDVGWTPWGNTKYVTAKYKFGTASIYFDGSEDRLAANTLTGFQFGSGDFSFGGFIWVDSLPTAGQYKGVITRRASSTADFSWVVLLNGDETNKLQIQLSTSGTGVTHTSTAGSALPTGQWVHVWFERYGANLYVFINGTPNTPTSVGTSSFYAGTVAPTFGTLGVGTSQTLYNFTGWIDHWVFYKGVAKYQGQSFTPPASAYLPVSCSAETSRRLIYDAARTEVDGVFTYGELKFTSGDNTGLSSAVKSFQTGLIELVTSMPRSIDTGDAYEMIKGCSKLPAACQGYSNMVNFGGYDAVPTPNTTTKGPD